MSWFVSVTRYLPTSTSSNVFVADSDQTLNAISYETSVTNTKTHYKVYLLNEDAVVPDDGEIVAEANLIAIDNYKSPSFIDITHSIFDNWAF